MLKSSNLVLRLDLIFVRTRRTAVTKLSAVTWRSVTPTNRRTAATREVAMTRRLTAVTRKRTVVTQISVVMKRNVPREERCYAEAYEGGKGNRR